MAYAARTSQEAVAMLMDPVAAGELQAQRAVEAAGCFGNRYPPRRRDGAAWRSARVPRSLLLLSHGHLVLEQDAEPLHMVESIASRVLATRSRRLLVMPSRPSSRRRSIVGCCSNVVLLNGSSGNSADVGVQGSASCPRCASPSWSRAELKDGGDALAMSAPISTARTGSYLRLRTASPPR